MQNVLMYLRLTLVNQLSTTIHGVACRIQQSHVIRVVCGNCTQSKTMSAGDSFHTIVLCTWQWQSPHLRVLQPGQFSFTLQAPSPYELWYSKLSEQG